MCCQNTLNRWFRIFKKHERSSRRSAALLPSAMKAARAKGWGTFKELCSGGSGQMNTTWHKNALEMWRLYIERSNLIWKEEWNVWDCQTNRDSQPRSVPRERYGACLEDVRSPTCLAEGNGSSWTVIRRTASMDNLACHTAVPLRWSAAVNTLHQLWHVTQCALRMSLTNDQWVPLKHVRTLNLAL